MSWRSLGAGAVTLTRSDTEELEGRVTRELETRYGARDVVLTDSGTSALRLAIAGAVGGSDRTVALPGYSCYDMATAAEGAGARVALYDVDPTTLGPDLDSLSLLRAPGLAAVVVAHLFGHLVDMSAAADATGDAILIEDAAQGVGGRLDGRPLGSHGSVSVLSFGRGKGLTGGGGGALLALDDRGVEVLEWARRHAPPAPGRKGVASLLALTGQLVLGRPELYGIPASLPFLHLGETRYHSPQPPLRPSASSLAVIEGAFQLTDHALPVRTSNAQRVLSVVSESARVSAMTPVRDGEPGYLRLPVLLRPDESNAVVQVHDGRLGLAMGYPTPLTALPSLLPHLVAEPKLPGATTLAESLVTLPTHGLLAERDLAAVEEWLLHE